MFNKRFIFWQGGATFDQINAQVQAQQQSQKASQGMSQADIDKIWGTHTAVSPLPQAPARMTDDQARQKALTLANAPVTDFLGNVGNGVLGGLKQMVGGLQQVGQSGSDITDAVRGTKSSVTGKVPNAGDIASGFVQGASNTLSGVEGAAFAPESSAVEALPDIAKVPIKGVMALPGQAVGAGVTGVGKLLGADTNSQGFQDNFVKPAQTILNTALATNPELISKPLGAAGDFAKDMISEVKNAGSVGDFKASLPEEMQAKFANQPTSAIAKTPEFQEWKAQQPVPSATPAQPPTMEGAPESPQNGISPEAKQEYKNDLLRSGVPEKIANGVSQASPEHRAILSDYMKTGLAQHADPFNIDLPKVWDKPAGEIEDFIQKADAHLDDIGQKQGAAAAALPDNVRPDPTKIENVLNEHLSKLNVKNTPDGLDFSASHIKGAGEAQGIIQDIAKTIDDPNATAKDYEALTSQIDDATGALSRRGVINSKANTALTQLKTAINSTVGDISPEFQEHNTNYAKLVKDLNIVKDATKVNVAGGNDIYDGTQLLKRISGDAPGKYQEALKSMQNIEKNFGIESPKDIAVKARLADVAEKYTNTNQSRNMQGAVQSGVQAGVKAGTAQLTSEMRSAILNKVPVVGGAIDIGLRAHDLHIHPELLENIRNQGESFTKDIDRFTESPKEMITPNLIPEIQKIIDKAKPLDPFIANKMAKSLAKAIAYARKNNQQVP